MQKIIGLIAGSSSCALASELHKRGLKAAAVLGRQNEPGCDIADYVLVCDLSQHESIIAYFHQLQIKHVIIGTGSFVAIELCKRLISNGFHVNIDPEKFELCKNKYLLNELMRRHGINTPEDRMISKDEDLQIISTQLRYPIVVKSIKDLAPPQKIDNREAFLSAASELLAKEECIMTEEYIRGNDVTVFMANDEELFLKPIYWSKGLENKLKGFEASYSEPLSKEDEYKLLVWCRQINAIVQIPGIYRIDQIVAKEKFYFFEINTLLVSSLDSSAYGIKFFQAEINRAEQIVAYALKKFALAADRVSKRLTVTGDDLLINSTDPNELYVHESGIGQLYKNEIDDYGINLFLKYLAVQPDLAGWDKEDAQNALLCVLTSDAEIITICEPLSSKKRLLMEAAKFLHKKIVIQKTPFASGDAVICEYKKWFICGSTPKELA